MRFPYCVFHRPPKKRKKKITDCVNTGRVERIRGDSDSYSTRVEVKYGNKYVLDIAAL